jgi:hypothetical protein
MLICVRERLAKKLGGKLGGNTLIIHVSAGIDDIINEIKQIIAMK